MGAGLVPARMGDSPCQSSPVGDPGKDKPCPYYFVTAVRKLDNAAIALIQSATLVMSEKGDRKIKASDSTPLQDGSGDESLAFTEPAAVERRIWRNIFVVVALAVVAAAIFADLRFMLGLVLGGGLALLNYKWLHSSLKGILAVGSQKTPPGTTLKFIVRWLVVASVAWLANKTGYFDAVAILAGLFAPALAVMMEAAYTTYRTLAQHNGE